MVASVSGAKSKTDIITIIISENIMAQRRILQEGQPSDGSRMSNGRLISPRTSPRSETITWAASASATALKMTRHNGAAGPATWNADFIPVLRPTSSRYVTRMSPPVTS
jgi:hypothetical protein